MTTFDTIYRDLVTNIMRHGFREKNGRDVEIYFNPVDGSIVKSK
jgi:hypothetical protein